ncbi:probable sodium/metabolite cotransporter BASS5, chloroplastic isoform X2 [Amborella trichopoda]|uniref:probable sodium/metabolite cotransporter BASS5, chloroplastic isoform X2 n=1 Tax=Amborella trichopoda TaxID=13333 RepID=UPI0005D2E28F|nr:probable sodium/metabolite cotransporter BASS5, chloroplastic isoform X2 [Amborella trichopoda]|eukprot:XP_011628404.1 probable sodium/metabolite cotransporter BASS5, chloroplastic isoform X2 [Amborella trichopoda]
MSSANSGALLQSPSSFPAPLPVRFSRWKVSYPVLVRGQDSCSSGFLKSPSLDRSYHGRVMSAFTAELFEATLRRCKPLSLVCSLENSRLFVARCQSEMTFESSELNLDHQQGDTLKDIVQNENGPLMMMKNANSILPHVVIASTVLALIFPPSFTWFTTRYWAPALGFLMFAVGVNSTTKDFLEAVKRPGVIAAGFAGQYIIKPLLGYILGTIAVSHLRLPDPIGSGIMLVSCVSGAQLSNYATFLTDPAMAPLSIVMTSLSTATAVFITPFLSLLLIGKRLPVDVRGMMTSIMQIVIAPIAAGLLLNR